MPSQEKRKIIIEVMYHLKQIENETERSYKAERLRREHIERLKEAPPIRVSLSSSLEYSALVLLVLVLILTAGVLFFALKELVAGSGF